VLLGTHFDTRWIADRDPDPARRGEPIPGVNDGGSGTAVLLALGRAARAAGCRDDLIFAFFDAEDLGGIAGNPYALGAIQYVRRGGLPDEAVILDMVGGLDMSLSVDLNSIAHEPSWNLTQEILSAGQAAGLAPFRRLRGAYIGCDHTPFQRAGVAAALLIDINYPQWHMHADTLDACCKESLGAVGQVLLGRIIDNAPPVG
jgi:Zn-dependent M28 family amino/carboxypeptidase